MNIYTYQFDPISLEVFPPEIWQDPNIIFHGTTSYHSNNIENMGFLCRIPNLFDLDTINDIALILKQYQICSTTYNALIESINRINDYQLSFAYLSSLCIPFAIGERRGGQVFLLIRKAEKLIKNALWQSPELQIKEKVKKMFQLANDVQNSIGVIYAIKLKEPYNGLELLNEIIYSSIPINKSNIVGKILIPNEVDINTFNSEKIKNTIKIHKNKLDALLENPATTQSIIDTIEKNDIEIHNSTDIKNFIKKI